MTHFWRSFEIHHQAGNEAGIFMISAWAGYPIRAEKNADEAKILEKHHSNHQGLFKIGKKYP